MKWDVSVLRMPSRNVYPLGTQPHTNFTQTQPEKKTHSIILFYMFFTEVKLWW